METLTKLDREVLKQEMVELKNELENRCLCEVGNKKG